MKYIPLLFQPPMIRASMNETKTLTTRILTKHNSTCSTLFTGDGQGWHSFDFNDVVFDGKYGAIKDYWYIKVKVPINDTRHRIFCKWEKGDIIWARESGWVHNNYMRGLNDPCLYWKADYDQYDEADRAVIKNNCGHFPGIHMYKEFCRMWLEITGVKVERLQDISQEDCIAEGIEREWDGTAYWYKNYEAKEGDIPQMFKQDPKRSFQSLWLKIHGQASWDQNPIVWRVSYKKIQKPAGFLNPPKNIPAKDKKTFP